MTTTTARRAIIAAADERCRNPARPAVDVAGEVAGLYAKLAGLVERAKAGEDVKREGRAVLRAIKERAVL